MKNTKVFSSVTSRNFISLALMFSLATAVAVPLQSYAATLSRELQFGMNGSDVSSLQTFLASDSSVYPQGLITGYFGSMTRSAVSRFQAKNGISQVGRVGPQTLSVINAQMTGNTIGTHENAPIISALGISTTNNSATVSWNTDEGASALVYYSISPITMQEASQGMEATISGTSFLAHVDLRTTHAAVITGLQANTTYNYVIYTRDASGNVTVTWPTTFHTAN